MNNNILRKKLINSYFTMGGHPFKNNDLRKNYD